MRWIQKSCVRLLIWFENPFNCELVFGLTLWVIRTATIETGNTKTLDNVFKVPGYLDGQLSGWSQDQYLQTNKQTHSEVISYENHVWRACARVLRVCTFGARPLTATPASFWSFSINGTAKEKVFPVPVLAWAITSSPSYTESKVFTWMSNR